VVRVASSANEEDKTPSPWGGRAYLSQDRTKQSQGSLVVDEEVIKVLEEIEYIEAS